MMSHDLVVGGTRMLRGVSLYLVTQGNTVSVIARSQNRLKSLAEKADSLKGTIHPIQIDYREGEHLRVKLKKAVDLFGSISLVVSWIHSAAPEAPSIVADSVGRESSSFRFFDIWGFLTEDPWHVEREKRFLEMEKILYRKITLGFVIENGVSRWLTNEEISSGVIQAIEKDKASFVVGRVEPRSAHP